jgi:peptide deformylase
MAILDIITYPDPVLKKKADPIEVVDDQIQQLILDMADTLYSVHGIGLAAPQVGVSKRLLLYDLERKDLDDGLSDEERLNYRNYKVIINPEVLSAEGEVLSEKEGCLSVPDFRTDVNRFEKIHIKAMDENENTIDIETEEYIGVVLQHEMDHLDGILLVDYVSSLKREMYKRRIKKKRKSKKKK